MLLQLVICMCVHYIYISVEVHIYAYMYRLTAGNFYASGIWHFYYKQITLTFRFFMPAECRVVDMLSIFLDLCFDVS